MTVQVQDFIGADDLAIQPLADIGLNSLEVKPLAFRVNDRDFLLTLGWLQRHERYYYVIRDARTRARIRGGLLPPNEAITIRSVLPDPRTPDLRIWFASRREGQPPIRPDTIGQNFVLITAAGRFPW